jgi:hypothetical protein
MSGDPFDPKVLSDSFIDPVEKPPVATTPSQGFTHFETPIPTTYELPLDLQPASLAPGESSSDWLGPVHIPNTGGSRRSFRKVVDRDGVNTLMFTSNQVIGLMLGPDDLQYLNDSGPIKTAANQALQAWQYRGGWIAGGGVQGGEDAIAKGIQFGALNANHWEEMVDALSAQPLDVALGNHLNFGLPYDRIQSVQVKNRFVNPGLTFHLSNGSTLRYGVFGKRDRLSEAAKCLQQYVKVQ